MSSGQAGLSVAMLLAVAAVNLAIGLACTGLSLVLDGAGGTMAGFAGPAFFIAAYATWRAGLARLAPGKYGWVGHPLVIAVAYALCGGAGTIAFTHGMNEEGTSGVWTAMAGVILGVVGFYGFLSIVILSAGRFIVGLIPPRWRFTVGCCAAAIFIAFVCPRAGIDASGAFAVLCGAAIVAIVGGFAFRAVMAANEAAVKAISKDSPENLADASREGNDPG